MFKNYFVTALRHLLRNKLYSLINILGLAIGLAACLLIFLFVRYETSYDNWLPGAENIYRVNYVNFIVGSDDYTCGCAPGIAKGVFEQQFPEIEQSTRFYPLSPVITQEERSFTEDAWTVDANFFDVFDLTFIEGNSARVFDELSNIVISQRTAKKYFGNSSPLGQIMTFNPGDEIRDYKITGVFEDIPDNSEFNFEILYPIENALFAEDLAVNTSWYHTWGYYYLKLRDGTDPDIISRQLEGLVAKHVPKFDARSSNETVELSLVNVKDIHLYSSNHPSGSMAGIKPLGNINQVYTFSVVAFLILLIACINFTNLSTARSMRRAKEVSLRKVVGANRKQIIRQFLGENILIATSGLFIALVMVDLTLPSFNALLGLPLKIEYSNDPMLIAVGLGLLIFVGVIAGLYPAFYLSAFRPAEILGGDQSGKRSKADKFRTGLTIFQFSISIALIIATAVVYGQNLFGLSKDLGYSKENKLVVRDFGRDYVQQHKTTIAEEIKRIPAVEGISYSAAIPTDTIGWWFEFKMLGEADTEKHEISPLSVDADFFDLYDIPILAGRDFDKSREKDLITKAEIDTDAQTNVASAILSQSAVRLLGFASPEAAIGQIIETEDFELEAFQLEVIGVVPDYNFNSVKAPLRAFVYWSRSDWFWNLTVNYREGTDTAKLQSDIAAVWNEFIPDIAVSSSFIEDRVAAQYDTEIKQNKMLLAFSILAVVVACLGLYGLAAFTAEQRTKEIAIRKVHGADVWDVVKLLLVQFSKPVLVSNLIAWPVAWFVMTDYLNGFVFRIDLSPSYFIGTGLIALVIAWATTTHRAIKVARTSPAVVLSND